MLYLNAHTDSYSEADIEWIVSRLPEWRREQALRFRHLEGRRQSALAYDELCRGLREEYGIEEAPTFEYGQHGKPTLASYPHIHFSLSHCRKAVGCLLSDRPCGLDIECIRPLRPSLVEHTMTPIEQALISSSPNPDIAFVRLWTQKEAVLKLRGTGISEGLREALSPESLQGISVSTEEHLAEGFVLSKAVLEG
ncbi:MAG: 4'-phosphopantetheinyl transferase superfamily protein [Bacteroidaceae bacterium]|nr:4'-phosphopantetheinyl transferase superfamily protein [Bacteroidaceae bacterium]